MVGQTLNLNADTVEECQKIKGTLTTLSKFRDSFEIDRLCRGV
jgi:hypothetical protein